MTTEAAGLVTDPAQLVTSLFAVIPVPLAIVDDSGHIILSNAAFSDLFQNIDNIQAVAHREVEVPGHGLFELETVPLNDQGLKIVYATNITGEAQLRREVVHLEKMSAIGRLVSGVAHELNNPLAGILGYAQLVARAELDPVTRRMVDVILAQAERAGKIVQNFLKIASKTDAKRSAFDLNEVIRNVIQLRQYEQSVDNITIKTELCEDLPFAWGDPHNMEQVFLNLIVNAEDAIGEVQRRPGTISIKTSVEQDRIHVSVRDTGSGIHARDLPRIFEPFFTTKEKRGTGLGLSICADIVKSHGGELYAWSSYGSGSTFTLELPVRSKIELEEIEPVSPFLGQSMLRGKQVLVIDDEIHITELIFDVLTRQGARIDIVNSGAGAIEQIKKKPYDVIICDQRMPGVSGQRLYRQVESLNPELRHRFLFVTGDVVNTETKKFFAQARIQYIRKPFRILELVDAIEALLSRTQPLGS